MIPVGQSMKMIASTKLAKAQRALNSGKEYGLANNGTVVTRIHPLPITDISFIQRSTNNPVLRTQLNINSSLSFPQTKVFAVVSTPLLPKPHAVLSQTGKSPWMPIHPS